ncbi:head completion/stabilization protein [Trinickia mobilis]|uniref:head completion/stabilization protein n=1 Tax=Trinickia mobilis TaxID=2816356 RepID=UPI001A90712B|nr:head completion/stabilization protein [Trinickia mobilis]
MSSFIATADPTVPASPADAATVTNDGWFPDIDLTDLRDAMRLDGTVTQERLRLAAVDAIASVNNELRAWQSAQRAAGRAALASVPAPQLGGVSTHVLRYRRAVYNLTRADLTEQYRAYDATRSGGQHAEDLEATICESRRNVRWALNDLRGIARSTIELI